jgi:probable HAF family extracellular repeat protein
MFLKDKTGFNDLGTFEGGNFATGTGINDKGQILGSATDKEGVEHVVVYDGSSFIDLGTSQYAVADRLTNRGTVLAMIDNPVANSRFSVVPIRDLDPAAMNGAGTVATVHYVSGPTRRFAYQVWMPHGQEIQKLEGIYGVIDSIDMNRDGVVVGTERGREFFRTAFVSRNAHLVYLDHLIPRNRGWNVYKAGAINDKGQIAAIAEDFNGDYHMVLLTPTKGM